MLIDLLVLVVVVGLVVWALSLLPLPAPFQQVILVIGIIIVLIALLQVLLGIDVTGHVGRRWFR